MNTFKKELNEYKAEVEKLAKKSVVMDLMVEFSENNYTDAAQFNGALSNKIEELNKNEDSNKAKD